MGSIFFYAFVLCHSFVFVQQTKRVTGLCSIAYHSRSYHVPNTGASNHRVKATRRRVHQTSTSYSSSVHYQIGNSQTVTGWRGGSRQEQDVTKICWQTTRPSHVYTCVRVFAKWSHVEAMSTLSKTHSYSRQSSNYALFHEIWVAESNDDVRMLTESMERAVLCAFAVQIWLKTAQNATIGGLKLQCNTVASCSSYFCWTKFENWNHNVTGDIMTPLAKKVIYSVFAITLNGIFFSKFYSAIGDVSTPK